MFDRLVTACVVIIGNDILSERAPRTPTSRSWANA